MWEFWRSRLGKNEKSAMKEKKKRMGKSIDIASQAARMFSAPAEKVAEILAGLREQDQQASTSHVHFKDMRLAVDSDSEEEIIAEESGDAQPESGVYTPSVIRRKRVLVEKHKLIIIMVGLPGRGKTYLCNKIKSYLTWLGHPTRHFNVGMYRRQNKKDGKMQDAAFFDKNNSAGLEARQLALDMAINDMLAWLRLEQSQVAIFDATNTTRERREYLRSFFHGKIPYLFIESICSDMDVLEQNYRYKMLYSPDYAGITMEKAMSDFRDRISKYEEVYETVSEEHLHYIKLIDMVTGRGQMVLNRISGYIPGKLVFFLMQICKHGLAKPRKIWLTRHGESQFNTIGRIGGDSGLSDLGQVYARRMADLLLDRIPLNLENKALPVSVWTSTLKRTIQTAQNLPFPKLRWKALDEIQAGEMEGMTYEEIEKQMPEEFEARKRDKLAYRYPRGESYLDLVQRLEPVIIEVERERECVCIVGHQAVLRVLYGYLMNVPQHEIPTLNVPLHTVIELTPKPDGTMYEERFFVDVTSPEETHGRGSRGTNASTPAPGSMTASVHASHLQTPSAASRRESHDVGAHELEEIGPMSEAINIPAQSAPPAGAEPARDESKVGSEDLISHLAMMEFAAKEAKGKKGTFGGTSMPDLGVLSSVVAHGAASPSPMASTPVESAPSMHAQSVHGSVQRGSKSTVDLSQLLPENLPDANRDVLSPYEMAFVPGTGIFPAPGDMAHPRPAVLHGSPSEGNPGHPKHPGNYTPNQGTSPRDSHGSSPRDITGLSGRQPETVPASDMYYGKPDEPVEWESPQKGPTQ